MIEGVDPRLANLLHVGASYSPVKTEQQKQVNKLRDQLFAEQEQGGVVQRTVSEPLLPHVPRKRSWWWVELWWDKRELVKGAVAHSLIFAGLLGSLEIAHRLLKWSTLPPEQLYVLDKVHFYMYAIILVIFAFSFVVKMLRSEFAGNEQ